MPRRLSNFQSHCAGCGYPLHALTGDHCPECGRRYVPDDPSTFLVPGSTLDLVPILAAWLVVIADLVVVALSVWIWPMIALILPVMLLLLVPATRAAQVAIKELRHTTHRGWGAAARAVLVIQYPLVAVDLIAFAHCLIEA